MATCKTIHLARQVEYSKIMGEKFKLFTYDINGFGSVLRRR
jgi:hypothetical protein